MEMKSKKICKPLIITVARGLMRALVARKKSMMNG
jgi:hypothetical protein